MRPWFGVVRVLALAAMMLGVALVLTLGSAKAQLRESLHGIAEPILNLPELFPHSTPRRLAVNGIELYVMSSSTTLDVRDALDRFQGACHSVASIDLPAALKENLRSATPNRTLNSLGVMREETEHEGFLACVDAGERLDAEMLLRRLREFGTTRNLRSLGSFRYALARREGSTTTLVMFWTDGDAKLDELLPMKSDAPGIDLNGVPRPTDARRMLSAFVHGMPYGLVVYELSAASDTVLLNAYEKRLNQAGWRTTMSSSGAIIAEKTDRRVLVRGRSAGSKRVFLSLLDAG